MDRNGLGMWMFELIPCVDKCLLNILEVWNGAVGVLTQMQFTD